MMPAVRTTSGIRVETVAGRLARAAGALLGALALWALCGAAQAQSAGTVVAGPFTVTLPNSSPFSFSRSFNVPPPLANPYVVRVELSAPNSLTAASVNLNNTQVFRLSDFANGVTRVDRVATLLLSNTLALQVTGATGTKITVTVFTVVMPKPVALAPNPLASTAGTSGTLTATLSPVPTAAGTLNVTSSNAAVASVPGGVSFASGQASVAIPVSALGSGSTTVTASANGGQAAATVNVNAPPTVSLTAPANGAVFQTPATLTLTANAADADGTVAKVEFFDGATLVATVTAAPYSVTLANVAVGMHSFTARATDNLGASTTSAAVSVKVNAPPSVALTGPANGATFTAPATIALAATATDTDGTIAKVEFFQGATLIAAVTAAPYNFTWTNVAQGSYTLTARATDNDGAATTSAPVTITVNSAVKQLYYIHPDHLNTPRLIANQAGTTVWRWDQGEPFGNDVPNNNPSGAGAFDFPLRFPGQYFDREINLAYNAMRDYDPGIGRYVESDPIGLSAGLNTYAYGNASPLVYIDPDGLKVRLICRPVSGPGIGLIYDHCFVHVTCPEQGIDTILSLFGTFPYIFSKGHKRSGTPGDPKFPDNPNSPKNTYDKEIEPCGNKCCAYEKDVIRRFNGAPPELPYEGPLFNSNNFARYLITSPAFCTGVPSDAPTSAPGLR
jgi:RHS repeat-associated protein